MKKMRIILLAVLAIASINVKAQSSDAAYPMGSWQTNTDDEKTANKYFIYMNIFRYTDENGSCGLLEISDINDTDKKFYYGDLYYSHKMLDDNNMGNGTYVFKVKSDEGKESTIWVNAQKYPMVTANGELKNHPAFNQRLQLCDGGLTLIGEDAWGVYRSSEKELLDALRLSLKDPRADVEGFGNLRQFINAHAKLDPNKPKYAKPKGTGSINIREKANATAAKIGELKAGETALVTDEFNGWCLIKTNEKQTGWVSLSVVTLTNTPGSMAPSTAASPANKPVTTTAAAPAEKVVCPITGDFSGYLGNKGWGEWSMFLQAEQKVGVNSKMPKRVSNGSIDLTDEEFVNERNYNLVFVRTVSPGVYEFTLQCIVNKQLKSGKMQFKVSGDKITMIGLDAWTKQQPFHGKTIGKSNPVIQ